MTDEELVKRLLYLHRVTRDYDQEYMTSADYADMPVTTKKAADRIEALTEQLEAARADAKEAEAYAEELEKEIELNEQEACMVEDDLIKADKEIDDLKAKLAKAVEGLRDAVDAWDNHNKTGDMMQGHWVTDARTTLAEIEGEEP
jgi:chromosome segregation ATPase